MTSYTADKDCQYIIANLQQPWSDRMINTVSPAYRMPLRKNEITWEHSRLVWRKPVEGNTTTLLLIIVPQDLRLTICHIYHASPIGGHMGHYKTLYHLQLRFFWPNM